MRVSDEYLQVALGGSPNEKDMREDLKEARTALRWIAQQACDRTEDGTHRCAESSDCITEWCLPCYAEKALEGGSDEQG